MHDCQNLKSQEKSFNNHLLCFNLCMAPLDTNPAAELAISHS